MREFLVEGPKGATNVLLGDYLQVHDGSLFVMKAGVDSVAVFAAGEWGRAVDLTAIRDEAAVPPDQPE